MFQLEKATQGARLFGLALVGVIVIVIALAVGTSYRDKKDVKAGCQQLAANRMTYEDAEMVGMTSEYMRQNDLLAECREKGFIN